MGYKLIGYVVWKLGRLYLRRRFPGARRKLAIAGVAGVLIAAGATAFALQRRANGS